MVQNAMKVSWLVIFFRFILPQTGPLGQDRLHILRYDESAKDKGIWTNPAACFHPPIQGRVDEREKQNKDGFGHCLTCDPTTY
jgi:hypothetical protein